MSPIRSCPNRAWMGTASIRLLLRSDQRALALVEGPEGLIRGHFLHQLVVVPGPLRFRRLLHLVEVHRVQLAPVLADAALPEDRVVGGRLLHLLDDGPAVAVALQSL